ncbi:MAG: acyltransferase domain-containing protein [Deltaproteobacteria bacterium]|nr:acyltransferase domain-containing protein [Deltaproteobacteria bacterium]
MKRPNHLLVLSAPSDSALKERAKKVRQSIAGMSDDALANAFYTLNADDAADRFRVAVVAESVEQAVGRLDSFDAGKEDFGLVSGQATIATPGPVLLFSGQGAEYAQMGHAFYQTHPAFKNCIDRARELIDDPSRLSMLFEAEPPASDLPITKTQISLFVLEAALADLWKALGVSAAAVMGHSTGEYAAAYAAGALTLEQGIHIVCRRSELLSSLTVEGATALVFAPEGPVKAALEDLGSEISIAAINGPENITIAGTKKGLAMALLKMKSHPEVAKRGNLVVRKVKIPSAAHSVLLDPILDDFEQAVRQAGTAGSPKIPLVSNVTGDYATDELADASHWRRHLRQTVRFADGLKRLTGDKHKTFVEVGPHVNLSTMGRMCLPDMQDLVWLPTLRESWDPWTTISESIGAMYVRGVAVDLAAFDAPYSRERIEIAA